MDRSIHSSTGGSLLAAITQSTIDIGWGRWRVEAQRPCFVFLVGLVGGIVVVMTESLDILPNSGVRDGAAIRPAWLVWPFKGQTLIGIVLPLTILALWQTAASRMWIDAVFLPAPITVVTAFWKMLTKQKLAMDFLASITIVGQAFIYGSVVAVVLGIAAGLSRKVEQFFGPTFDTIRHIPGIAWLPLIVLWLGIGAPAKVLVIAKSVFFPVFLNTLQGIRNVEKNYIELAEVLTLTRWQLVRKVILPAATPSIIVSLRYAAGLAWALVVVAEGLSGLEGLGFLIFRAQGLLLTDQLLVCMVIIGVVGFLIDRSMYFLQRRVLRWKQGYEG